ncbi:T9SS type A sorting domain-containing protein [Spirosoma sp. RP8]|uniref:T9SS type A sorting domain-containing protein n=1 Tax=Spirosoma liriopis TaxID=2937440 RepID=A0ABT0HHG5_9BACT|nr:sialate O-acetylesterase [Spirosoma liriopis]MCK8491595.1 T9SS type A sorting domain-containing protein [Spirosoma liriopis]
MKQFSLVCCLVVGLLLPTYATAQIQVSFPTSRAVFQRNASNQATFRITGYYTVPITQVQARVQARNNQGTSTDWQTILDNPSGGIYSGDLTVTGGWYDLQVRGLTNGQQVGDVTTIERVGVGEVFVIAGQSNAQGVHYSAPVSTDDRVNCVNYKYPENAYPNDPPVPQFSHLDNSDGFIVAPRGMGSWYWGRLGDLLATRLNVPIMFFNAAFTGTSIRNWSDSAPEGGAAYGYGGSPYPARQPYAGLKVALQSYANILGIRAVLWHQGEADNVFNTTTQSYVTDLQFVINQTRQDYGRNISWVVARASHYDPLGASNRIIAAQNQVISTVPNVFPGPSTDTVQVPRYRAPLFDPDRVHFDYNGLVTAATLWNGSLDDSFFQRSTPFGPALAPTVSVACAGNNLTFTVNGTYSSVQWESGESGRSITKGPGALYRAKVKDASGNTNYTGYLRVSDTPIASVANNRLPIICAGTTLALTSNYDNVTWLSQPNNMSVASGRTFNASLVGSYSARYRDVSGCDFTSNTLQLTTSPLPATPTITNGRSTTFCQGDNTTLQASSNNVVYNWSDGQKVKQITVTTSGSYTATVTDQNGCTSLPSNVIQVVANPVPAKPTITASGATTFCADRNVVLTAPTEAVYEWNNGQTVQSLTVTQSGDYSIVTRNRFGCTSERSDVVTTKVNPLPATPSVSAGGATTFCAGNSVTLNAASPLNVVWSSGQTSKAISVTQSGNYAVQSRDQNGCLSTFSPRINVRVNALPNAPAIVSTPSATICQGDRATLTVEGPYTVFWSTGDSTRAITTGQAGNYSARIRDQNGCVSTLSAATTVDVRALPPAPTINAIGTYTLEAVSSTNGERFRWRRDTDSLAVQTAIIKAGRSGNYTARSSIVYSNTLTCFSLPSAPFLYTIDASFEGLSVYPNPNPNKVVTLETQENLSNATVTLYKPTGQRVLTRNVGLFDERKQLILTDLPSGVYILRVEAAGFSRTRRILLGL